MILRLCDFKYTSNFAAPVVAIKLPATSNNVKKRYLSQWPVEQYIIYTMRLLKTHPILGLMNSYMVDSPQPASISYMWNFGSLLGACLVIQIITGITLAMHYTPNIDLAFVSVEHIMRDVHYGWLIRYMHANVASFFFIFVYLHIGRGLYYGSYRSPRVLLWSIGVIILVLMMATAFLGYVLPYGQMSLWGRTVITNLLSAIPWIGQDFVQFVFTNILDK